MEQFIHQNNICPKCKYSRSWKLRRGTRKCKRCRKEWSPKRRIEGFRSLEHQWRKLLFVFLRDHTITKVSESLHMERHVVQRMIAKVRMIMTEDIPTQFSGTVEMDETYIGGKWINKPAWIRRQGTKKGRGTRKQGIFGILSRDTQQVRTFLVSNFKEETIFGIITDLVKRKSLVYTDGSSIYDPMIGYGHDHHFVDHSKGEYVRGDVHTNTIESFWGYLKRRLSVTGGIRPKYFHLFVGELVWRYNYRHLSRDEQADILLKKLVGD